MDSFLKDWPHAIQNRDPWKKRGEAAVGHNRLKRKYKTNKFNIN